MDHAITVAGSDTHVYVAGRVEANEGDQGGLYFLTQYLYPAGSGQFTAQVRSDVSFPVYFGGDYEPTCSTSISVGSINTEYGFQYSQIIIAGTLPHESSGKLRPAIVSFHTKPVALPGSGFGDLSLMWSVLEDPIGEYDEIPVDVKTDAERVVVLSKLMSGSSNAGLSVRVYAYNDGKVVSTGAYEASSTTPAGVIIGGNYLIVAGSGVNGSGEPQAMSLAFGIEDDPGYFSAGDLVGASFLTSGSGRSFRATCFTAGENHQVNANIGGYYALAGRSHSTSSSSDGDWFVQTWTFEQNPSTHGITFTPGWSSVGKSSSSFDDVPVAMCLGLTPPSSGEDPLPAWFRLWVTGDRLPLSSGNSQVTTVQFNLSGGGGTSVGTIEWFNHYSPSGRNCRAASIGAMDFTTGLNTRAYVGLYVDSTTSGYLTDFAMLKYASAVTSPFPGGDTPNLWGNNAINEDAGAQVSASIMPLNIQAGGVGRTILITGRSGSPTDMRTLRYEDTED